jgi:hypothetical protein
LSLPFKFLNDTVSTEEVISYNINVTEDSNNEWLSDNILKESVIAYFKMLSQNYPEETEEDHEEIQRRQLDKIRTRVRPNTSEKY